MNEILYKNLNWGLLEGVRFSDIENPAEVLGPHIYEDLLTVTAFLPSADKVEVIFPHDEDRTFEMEQVDEEVFSVVTTYDTIHPYLLKITYGTNYIVKEDPYAFSPEIPEGILFDFATDLCPDIHKWLGAHPKTINEVDGIQFAVWAPMAQRVSVVGDFNLWDGRLHQMTKIHGNGIFAIFIPDIAPGELYKFEIRSINGDAILKADPYARFAELRPNTASIIHSDDFEWTDKEWLQHRRHAKHHRAPLNIYELHLGSFRRPEDGREFYNYREYAELVADYVKDMGYTHVELMPIMEHPYDASWGYQVTGFFAPTARYGTPEDFKFFVNHLHEQGIGVILDWVPAHFPKDEFGLARFDGSCVYEHLDPRQGEHPQWGTLIFNYDRNEVTNFLLANARYWLEEFHADGLRVDAVASMIYLDFGKRDNEWIPNEYGGKENLGAIRFMKNLNTMVAKDHKGCMVIAEESTIFPDITAPVAEDGMGFDYKWNMGWMNDFLHYIQLDPIYRADHQAEMTFSFSYAFSENFILVLSHDEVVHLKKSMIAKMPGDYEQKFANLRLAYGFMMTHPGKKLLFMGQDIAQFDEWNEDESVQWELLDYEAHRTMQNYVRDLNALYKAHPSLYYYDCDERGFQWINGAYEEESLCFFIRKSRRRNELLVIAANFTPIPHRKFRIGVPYKGFYKEIFNSDARKYGGDNVINRRKIASEKEKWDYLPYSISMNIPPLGISVLKFTGTK
ncbi:MAG: 1,4-alpha-glucan branching protein GlgB [Eubacteriales bacterium]|nr:1,4-alpha-glucan branching protein GlgB [Eubacteriales bacterium]